MEQEVAQPCNSQQNGSETSANAFNYHSKSITRKTPGDILVGFPPHKTISTLPHRFHKESLSQLLESLQAPEGNLLQLVWPRNLTLAVEVAQDERPVKDTPQQPEAALLPRIGQVQGRCGFTITRQKETHSSPETQHGPGPPGFQISPTTIIQPQLPQPEQASASIRMAAAERSQPPAQCPTSDVWKEARSSPGKQVSRSESPSLDISSSSSGLKRSGGSSWSHSCNPATPQHQRTCPSPEGASPRMPLYGNTHANDCGKHHGIDAKRPRSPESYSHNDERPDTPTFAAADEVSVLEGNEARQQRTEERYKRNFSDVSPGTAALAALPTTAKEQQPKHRSAAQQTSKSRRYTTPSGEVHFVVAALRTLTSNLNIINTAAIEVVYLQALHRSGTSEWGENVKLTGYGSHGPEVHHLAMDAEADGSKALQTADALHDVNAGLQTGPPRKRTSSELGSPAAERTRSRSRKLRHILSRSPPRSRSPGRRHRHAAPRSAIPCKFHLQGSCQKGAACPWSHAGSYPAEARAAPLHEVTGSQSQMLNHTLF